jgi:hypothetical protein
LPEKLPRNSMNSNILHSSQFLEKFIVSFDRNISIKK